MTWRGRKAFYLKPGNADRAKRRAEHGQAPERPERERNRRRARDWLRDRTDDNTPEWEAP